MYIRNRRTVKFVSNLVFSTIFLINEMVENTKLKTKFKNLVDSLVNHFINKTRVDNTKFNKYTFDRPGGIYVCTAFGP